MDKIQVWLFQKRWLILLHWNRNTYSHTSFSLIAFSYGHWISPQGEVQSDHSSYDNIIVRTVKGQTAAQLVLRGLCWENPQMASALLQGQHSAKCLWEGRECQRGPLSLLSPFLPSAFCRLTPAWALVWNSLLLGMCSPAARVQKCLWQQNLLCTCCLWHSRGISE